MSDSLIATACAGLTADGEGLELLMPCYVARQERVIASMGMMERFRECFPCAVEGAGLVALPWYEGIEELMESVNLHPFEDADRASFEHSRRAYPHGRRLRSGTPRDHQPDAPLNVGSN